MKIKSLNESNFQFYAMSNYDNPSCTDVMEFHEDMARFKYLKRLFRKYKAKQEIRPQLVINHLIVLYNVFGIESATNLLFYRIDSDLHSILKTYLVFLNYYPTSDSYISLCDECDIDDVLLDSDLYNELRDKYGREMRL